MGVSWRRDQGKQWPPLTLPSSSPCSLSPFRSNPSPPPPCCHRRHDAAAPAPAPWRSVPGYGSEPVPKPVMRVCVQTPFPDLCARALSLRVDPRSPAAPDTRRLAEMSARVAIEAGTALAAFGYVRIAGAKNDTRLRRCVRDRTVHVDAAVRSLNASATALRRGARGEALRQLGSAASKCGVCWGSCARFAGEAMAVMQRRARQFEKLVIVAAAIAALL